jgi:hypothetical protein
MKTNGPDQAKNNLPDSDETARGKHPYADDETTADASESIEGLQTSNKSGKHSSVEKLAASRPEFGAAAGAKPVDGAFGDDPSSSAPNPQENHFRCSGCGRYFNTSGELAAHAPECRLAKAATATGRDSLQYEDSHPRKPNDAGI